MYAGRNLDWSSDFDEKIVITPQSFHYASAYMGELSPRAGAIIGLALVENGVPLYFDCANEAGLYVAGLNFPEASYSATPIEGKTNIATYEFPLFIALKYSSVDEAERELKNFTIVGHPISANYPATPLHWFIADQSRAIVVEYTGSEINIYENEADVLTNAPNFKAQYDNLKSFLSHPQPESIMPGDYSSESRFIRVSLVNSHYPVAAGETANISRLFHTLSSAAMVKGIKNTPTGYEYTTYTSGYSTAEKAYYYNTYDNPTIRKYAFADYDLNSQDLNIVS